MIKFICTQCKQQIHYMCVSLKCMCVQCNKQQINCERRKSHLDERYLPHLEFTDRGFRINGRVMPKRGC